LEGLVLQILFEAMSFDHLKCARITTETQLPLSAPESYVNSGKTAVVDVFLYTAAKFER
jgi:hypothetical protein